MIGIYIHVPFCRTRCSYCDFVSNAVPGAVPDEFVETLCLELEAFEGQYHGAVSLFLGGGTPSLLAPRQLERILEVAFRKFAFDDAETTIEANPDDVTPPLLDAWRRLGINRVSIGVQGFDDAALRYLGRRHTGEQARRACRQVAERFANWGMDLIYGAHPIGSWESTLAECASFKPAHVSAYSLTYEPGTPFGARTNEAVDEDASLGLYRMAHAYLTGEGYAHYEVSNFARPGCSCRHNLLYWRNEEYAGFGPGAYSFLSGVRSRNHVPLSAYLANPGEKAEALELTAREIRTETLIQHFRLTEGLAKDYYENRFKRSLREDYGIALDALIARGLLEEDPNSIRPTMKGFELNNEIGLALVD